MTMAAEISPTAFAEKVSDARFEIKPALISKIEASGQEVNDAVFLPVDDGLITVADDKLLKIWIRKESGQYWPTLSHSLQETPTTIAMDGVTRRLLVGLGNGTIAEFIVSEDYRSVSSVRTYLAHQARVTRVMFCLEREWVISASRDKYLQVHCSETGRRLGGYQCNGTCSSLAFDERSCYAFAGDYSGSIHVLKLDLQDGPGTGKGVVLVTVIKGHSSAVQSLTWDPEKKYLYSGGSDQTVVIWDIGGQKGVAYELHGHRQRVMCVKFIPAPTPLLISSGDDAIVGIWNLGYQRSETPEWRESNNCELCGKAFFWNVSAMVSAGDVAIRRQHHCRVCGRAICGDCSPNSAPRPKMGFEFPVRICASCWADDPGANGGVSSEPLTRFFDSKQHVVTMDVDLARRRILTLGQDRTVKLWDFSPFFVDQMTRRNGPS